MNKKSNKQKIVLEFEFRDTCAILEYQKFLRRQIKLKNKIPARVLRKFFSLFTIPDIQVRRNLINRVSAVRRQTVDRYLNDKEYAFSKKLLYARQFFGSKTKSICCLNDLFKRIFDDIEKDLLKNNDKESIVKLINTSINEYFNSFEGATDKLFSKYKRDAIIGFIAYKLGFHLSKDIRELEKSEEPSNELLSQAIKYHTSKLKKSK